MIGREFVQVDQHIILRMLDSLEGRFGDILERIDLCLQLPDRLVEFDHIHLGAGQTIKCRSEYGYIDVDIKGFDQWRHRPLGELIHVLHDFVIELEVGGFTIFTDEVLHIDDPEIIHCDAIDMLYPFDLTDLSLKRLDDNVEYLLGRSPGQRYDHCTTTNLDLRIFFSRHGIEGNKPKQQDRYCQNRCQWIFQEQFREMTRNVFDLVSFHKWIISV